MRLTFPALGLGLASSVRGKPSVRGRLFETPLSVGCSASSIVSGDKEGDDGKEVVPELGGGGRVCVQIWSLLENHEPRIEALEEPFQEFHANTREAVAVGNHNFCDNSCTDALQKGEKPWTFPIETRGNVPDEVGIWAGGAECVALALKVGCLVCRADAGVADDGALSWLSLRLREPEDGADVGEPVEAFASPVPTADAGNATLVRPLAKCRRRDIKLGLDVLARDEGRLQRRRKQS